jgi:hypothetical protein
VAVDESLACSSVRDLKRGEKESENKKVIFYRKKVPLKPILHLLQNIEEKHIELELNRLIDTEINLKGNVLNVDEVAHSYGVGSDAIKRLSFQDYKIIGDTIISEDVLRSLRERIEAEKCDNYADAVSMIESQGIPGENAPLVLEAIGYNVRWNGLNIKDVRVVKSKW